MARRKGDGMWIRLRCRMTELMLEDDGMSTVEYAIGTMCQATTRRIARTDGGRRTVYEHRFATG